MLGMGGVVLGILVWQEGGEAVGALMAIGVVSLAGARRGGSVRRKRSGKPTLIDPDLFRSAISGSGSPARCCSRSPSAATMIALPIYLQMVLEYDAMQAGLSLAPLSLSMFAVALLAGKKAGERRAGRHHPGRVRSCWRSAWSCSSRSCRGPTPGGTSSSR